jgi:ribosomal protein S18 acetylase RimI-like enzyme
MVMIVEAVTVEHLNLVRMLFREYADSIGIDLCFQGFEDELRTLPGRYAPPTGGLFLAFDEDDLLGCVALRPLTEAGAAELKRLYVRPAGRGTGVGLALTQHAIARARDAHYRVVRLDTLATMQGAQRLYRRLGFREIPAYTYNPVPDVVYMELDLSAC